MNAYFIAKAIHGATSCIERSDGSWAAEWEHLTPGERLCAMSAVEGLIRDTSKTPEELHQIWYDLKVSDGWQFGHEFCYIAKTHPSMIPYNELPTGEKLKDEIWAALIEVFRPYYTQD